MLYSAEGKVYSVHFREPVSDDGGRGRFVPKRKLAAERYRPSFSAPKGEMVALDTPLT